MIKLIVDSTCDINESITDNYEIDVIPLSVTIDDISYLDGIDIDIETVYGYMREGKVPKTSQPSYESVTKVIDKCISNDDDFIYLAFSSKLSGTYNMIKKIIENYKERYPKRRMAIIDSKGGAGGTGLIALQTLKLIEDKLSFERIIEHIHFMVEHIVYYFTISDLEWLSKGGRISKPLGYVGNILNIKPYLTVKDGKIVLSKMIRGSKRVLQTIIKDMQSEMGNLSNQMIAISHANDIDAALAIEKKIKTAFRDCRTTIFQIGTVLGTHLGIGGVGVFFFNKKLDYYENI